MSGKVGDAALAQQVKAVAALQGEYRLSHLETHRKMRLMLTEEQVRRYQHLRGYTKDQQDQGSHQRQGIGQH